LGVTHYILSSVTKTLSLTMLRKSHRRCQQRQGAVSKTLPAGTPLAAYQDHLSNMLGCLAADALLFPLETVLHRLHLQGTRTLIDNLDSGREVIHIMTRYDGFFDCLGAVMREEGVSGLYRGFGALVLQYLVHFAIIRFSATAISEVAKLLSQDAPADLLARSRTEPTLAPSANSEEPTLTASRSNSRLPELTTGANLLRQQQHNLIRQVRSAENSPFPHQPHPQDPLSLGARRRIAPE
jgi:solute carrier family 25 protein 46